MDDIDNFKVAKTFQQSKFVLTFSFSKETMQDGPYGLYFTYGKGSDIRL